MPATLLADRMELNVSKVMEMLNNAALTNDLIGKAMEGPATPSSRKIFD